MAMKWPCRLLKEPELLQREPGTPQTVEARLDLHLWFAGSNPAEWKVDSTLVVFPVWGRLQTEHVSKLQLKVPSPILGKLEK